MNSSEPRPLTELRFSATPLAGFSQGTKSLQETKMVQHFPVLLTTFMGLFMLGFAIYTGNELAHNAKDQESDKLWWLNLLATIALTALFGVLLQGLPLQLSDGRWFVVDNKVALFIAGLFSTVATAISFLVGLLRK